LNNSEGKVAIIFENNRSLPHFLSRDYPKVKIGYRDIFPLLTVEALDWLDNKELEELYIQYKSSNFFDKLDRDETLIFAIKSLYETDMDNVELDNIIAFLIKFFFVKKELKRDVKEFIREKLDVINISINQVQDRNSFFNYLENEWKSFFTNDKARIDFSTPRLRYLIDDCFEQGFMEAIDLNIEDIDVETIIKEGRENYWVRSGIKNLKELSAKQEVNMEIKRLEELLVNNLSVRKWGMIAKIWGKISYLTYSEQINKSLTSLQKRLDEQFLVFIKEKYNSLPYDQRFQYAPLNNRILPYITEVNPEKFALICFDCMSFKDWQIIKKYLTANLDLNFKERFSFATVPTVTSYSRQTIFSGKLPYETDQKYKEEKAFKKYITEHLDIVEEEIYFTNEGIPEEDKFLGYKAVGLIYRFIDKSIHDALDPEGHYKNLIHLLDKSELKEVINNLLNDNFKIYFTSDHGNVYCEGNGVRISKALVEDKDTRAALYQYKNLAEDESVPNKVILQFPNIIGEDYIVTMKDRSKYGKKRALTHGGANIEEVIIPFIEVNN
ncbi:MAG: PglZ domain-containing protein, partial [Candidatus Frackibacter sp. T328-2]